MELLFKEEMKRIKAIIFDFDGTIANTMPFLTQLAVKLIVENYDIPEDIAKRRYLSTTGIDFAGQLEIMFPNHPNNHVVAQSFEHQKMQGIFSHPVFPEVIPTLRYLRKKNIKTFICSSTKQEIIIRYSMLNKIDHLLDGFFGFKLDFKKSNQIDFILKHYNLKQEEVFFVGDSLRDAEFAKDKKIGFIGISRIFKKTDFQRKGVLCVACLKDLIKLF